MLEKAGARMYRLTWLAGRQEVSLSLRHVPRIILSVLSHWSAAAESRRLTFHRNHASICSQVSFRETWCSISEFVFFRFQSDEPLLGQRSKFYLNVEQLCTGDAAQFEHVNLQLHRFKKNSPFELLIKIFMYITNYWLTDMFFSSYFCLLVIHLFYYVG